MIMNDFTSYNVQLIKKTALSYAHAFIFCKVRITNSCNTFIGFIRTIVSGFFHSLKSSQTCVNYSYSFCLISLVMSLFCFQRHLLTNTTFDFAFILAGVKSENKYRLSNNLQHIWYEKLELINNCRRYRTKWERGFSKYAIKKLLSMDSRL